jgi:hypothetical protein
MLLGENRHALGFFLEASTGVCYEAKRSCTCSAPRWANARRPVEGMSERGW